MNGWLNECKSEWMSVWINGWIVISVTQLLKPRLFLHETTCEITNIFFIYHLWGFYVRYQYLKKIKYAPILYLK